MMKISDCVAAIGAAMPISGRVSGLSPFFAAAITESQRQHEWIGRIAAVSQIDVDDVRKLPGAMRYGIQSASVALAGIYDDLLSGRMSPAELREIIRRIDQPLGAQDAKNRS